jgi:phosphatidylcholine synthase
MAAEQIQSPRVVSHPVAKGWLVHCFTALGAVCGMFGLIAVADGKAKQAILWLAVAMVLDGIDGPVARHWCVKENVPRIDGYTLDLIVDFVTCIVIPVVFLHQFGMLPEGWSLVIGAFVLFMSALWMSRTDQMSDDHIFNGFPCEWNMIVPTLYLLKADPWLVGAVCVLLSLTQLTNWKFVHPMQVKRFRPVTVTVTILWMLMVLVLTWKHPGTNGFLRVVLLACPLYILALGSWRTLSPNAVAQPSA